MKLSLTTRTIYETGRGISSVVHVPDLQVNTEDEYETRVSWIDVVLIIVLITDVALHLSGWSLR